MGSRPPPEITGPLGLQPLSQTATGGIGAPGGGTRSRLQWKICVRSECSFPSWGASAMTGAPSATMVIISAVSRACTCQTLHPLASTHHLTTRHFWAGLPASWTVMMRPVGSSAGGAD